MVYDPVPPPLRPPAGQAWWEGLHGTLQSLLQFLSESALFRSSLLLFGAALLSLFLFFLLRSIFARLGRAFGEAGPRRGLRLFAWELVSKDALKRALLRLLGALRLLGYAGLLWALLWALTAVLDPSLALAFNTVARGLWFSLGAVLLLSALVGLLRSLSSSLISTIQRREARIGPLRYGGFTILPAPLIRRGLILATRVLGWILMGLGVASTLTFVLSLFSFTWSWSRALLALFGSFVRPLLAAVLGYVPKLVFAALIVIVARLLLKLLKAFFTELGAGRLSMPGFQADWAATTYKILRAFFVALTAVMVFPYIPGSGTDAFKSVGIFLGVILSLGSSSFVGNVMAGVSLSYMNAFRVGDRVKVGGTMGDVVEQTLLVTRLRTVKNVVVTIPNSVLLSAEVENYSHQAAGAPLILHTGVTIGYEVPWREVHAALLEAASRVEGLLAEPRPFVLQTMLDNFAVAYELNASTKESHRMAQLYSELHRAIQDSFAEAGIEIMTPTYQSLRDGSASTIPPRAERERRGGSGASGAGEGGSP